MRGYRPVRLSPRRGGVPGRAARAAERRSGGKRWRRRRVPALSPGTASCRPRAGLAAAQHPDGAGSQRQAGARGAGPPKAARPADRCTWGGGGGGQVSERLGAGPPPRSRAPHPGRAERIPGLALPPPGLTCLVSRPSGLLLAPGLPAAHLIRAFLLSVNGFTG